VDDCCGTTTVGGKEVSFHNIAVSTLISENCTIVLLMHVKYLELVWLRD
jgi:hypothetical protein